MAKTCTRDDGTEEICLTPSHAFCMVVCPEPLEVGRLLAYPLSVNASTIEGRPQRTDKPRMKANSMVFMA